MDIVDAARLRAAADHPYLATALWSIEVRRLADDEGIRMDGRWRLHISERYARSAGVARIAQLLSHHVEHFLVRHPERGRAIGADLTPHDLSRWVAAADHELEVARLGARRQRIRLAEESYFDGAFHPAPVVGGCGLDVGESDESGEAQVNSGDLERLRCRVALEVQTCANRRGSVPGHLVRAASAVLDPQVDWLSQLSALLQGVTGAGRSRPTDYTYARPSRRQAAASATVVLPARRNEPARIVMIVDTSASVSSAQLGYCLAAARMARRTGSQLHLVSCDSEVTVSRRITHDSQISFQGGGGTDLRPALEEAIRHRPSCVVVITDGQSPWPSRWLWHTPLIVVLMDAQDDVRDRMPVGASCLAVTVGHQAVGAENDL